jgi:hypothetical protein
VFSVEVCLHGRVEHRIRIDHAMEGFVLNKETNELCSGPAALKLSNPKAAAICNRSDRGENLKHIWAGRIDVQANGHTDR